MTEPMDAPGQLTPPGELAAPAEGAHQVRLPPALRGVATAEMRGTEGATPLMGQDGIAPHSTKEPTMKNTFLSQTEDALRLLRRAQERRARHEAIAADRFGRAQVEYREKLALAAAVEGRAWKALQDVPGMTARTAAALCGVSVATVNRRTKGVSNG